MSGNPNNEKQSKITDYFPIRNASPLQPQNVPPPPERLMNVVRPLLPSSTKFETTLQHRIRGERHGQAPNEVVEENINLQANEEGQVNGEDVQLNQTFHLSIRRDLW